MQKLIVLLVLIACTTVVLGQSWGYYITYSNNNCTTPVAIELTQLQACLVKRSTEQAPDCMPLDSNPEYGYFDSCQVGMPNMTEFSALPIVVTTYPSSDNCTVKDYVRIYYFAENYSGPMLVTGRLEATVNTTCSDAGVLNAVVCTGSNCPVDLTLPENQCVYTDYSATQTGCAAVPPSAVPTVSETPNEMGAPQTQPSTTTGPSAVRTPNSGASTISGVISVIALFSLLF